MYIVCLMGSRDQGYCRIIRVIFLFVIERHARSVSNYVTSFVCVHSIPYINLVLMTFFLLRRVTTPCFHSPIYIPPAHELIRKEERECALTRYPWTHPRFPLKK